MPSYLKVASRLCVSISALFALAPSYIAFVHFRHDVGIYSPLISSRFSWSF